MTFRSWTDAVKELEKAIAPATRQQLELAAELGVTMRERTPAVVAAVLLRERLAGELLLGNPEAPSDAQRDYVRDLARAGKARSPGRVPTRAQMDAWIEVMQAKRAITALTSLKLEAGDVVAPIDGPDLEVDEVISIGQTGRVYFKGGQGAGARPHRLRVVARDGARTRAAGRSRESAANRRANRTRISGPPTTQRLAPLAEFEVKGGRTSADVSALEDVLDQAQDEAPVQKFLEDHPELFVSLRVSSYGTFVLTLPRLGSEYVPDFVLAIADSAGIHYTLIELESPRRPLSLRNGELSAKGREAVGQIESWREWLKDNLAYAQRPREQNGLGLPEIRPESPGLVLIGRRSEPTPYQNQIVRQRIRERQGISIHTYDWLLELLAPRTPRTSPLGPLDVALDWERPNPFAASGDLDDLVSAFE